MSTQSFILRFLLGLAALSAGLQAQPRNVYVLPLNSSAAGTGASFSADPFASTGSFPASPVGYQVLTNGAGTKLYVIGRSGSQTVLILDATNPNNTINSFNLGQGAQAAALTPDGRNLIVLTNATATTTGLTIISTVTDSVSTAGRTLDLGSNPIDLGISIDSRLAYVLSADSLRLSAVDLNAGTVVATQSFPVRPTSVSVAPNGFVYVTAANAIYEIDPIALTLRATIPVSGTPGKLQFSPDGRFASAVNTTPSTGSLLFDVDLAGRTLVGTIPQIAGLNEQLSNLTVVSATRAFATSALTGTLYDISLSPLGIGAATFNNAGTLTGVTTISATNEIPNARFLFIGTPSGLYRADLTTAGSPATGPLPLGFTPGAISYATPASTGPPTTLQLFNNNQAISSGQTFLPIVIRALDAQGRPVANSAVNFSAVGQTGITITGGSAFTNLQGFAQANVIAPTATGTYAINVSVGIPGASSQFTLAVGTSVPGGGTPGVGTISIYQGPTLDKSSFYYGGQGQLVLENFPAIPPFGQPLAVIVKDNQGNVLPNQQVVYTLTGGGALVTATGSSCTVTGNTAACTTDTNGVAYIGYFAGNSANGTVNPQDTITATANGNSIQFFETTYSSLPLAQPSVGLRTPAPGSVLTLTSGQVAKGAIVVTVSDRYGRGLPNIGLYLQRPADPTGTPLQSGPSAACVGGIVLTDQTGTATCDVIANGGTGSGPLLIVVGGGYRVFDTVQLNVTAGVATKIAAVQGDSQTVNTNTALPTNLVAVVTDASGNPLAGQAVTFEVVTPGSATLTPAATTTDATGRATTRVTAGANAGTFQIRARSGALSTLFTFVVNPTVSQIIAFGGTSQSAQVGTAFGQPLTVRVLDLSNNPVSGTTVNFAVTSGSATLSAASATTNAQGQATITATAGAVAGPVVVTATVGTFSTTFPLTVLPATPVGPALAQATFANAASFQTGTLTPGAIVTITAPGLAPGVQGVLSPTSLIGQLPTTLNGTQVLINNIPAPIFYILNSNGVEQITIQVPFEVQPGTASVVVNTGNGGTGRIDGVPVVPYQPGIFETGDASNRYAVAVRGTNGTYMTPANPLQRGETATIFLTGLGQTGAQPLSTNQPGQTAQNVSALIVVALESSGIEFVSATALQGEVGIYAVTFRVPQTGFSGRVKIGVTEYAPGTVVNGTNSLSSYVYIQ